MENQVVEIKAYRTMKSESREAALASVEFPVHRARMRFDAPLGGIQSAVVESERDAIFSVEDGKPQLLGYASPDYKLIPHREALDAMFKGLDRTGIPFQLKALHLDRNGAKMFAQFELLRGYDITKAPGDTLNPILTGVNSYDGNNALGFDLESIRLVCMNLARCAVKDFSQRFLHTGSADPAKLVEIAAKSLDGFERKVIPMYRELAKVDVTKEMAVRAVAVAVEQGAMPLNVAKFAKHCVDSDRATQVEGIRLTAWAMFNAFTWAATNRCSEVSPTRGREIRAGVAKLFADGGKDLLKQASIIPMERVNEVFQASA